MGDEPTAPGYMMLYGLLMTLLMTFFILLVSMGTQEPNKKMNTVITSIKSTFGAFGTGGAGILEGGGSIISNPDITQIRIMRMLRRLKLEDLQGIEFSQEPQKPGQPVKVYYDPLGRLHISFDEALFFTPGQKKISDKANLFLQRMLALYFDTPYGITIAGYSGGQGERDWFVGYEAALKVMNYLHQQGVPYVHLYPEGHKDDNLSKQVRVEIVLRAKEILERS